MKHKTNGITLIALVITIIVLLILAGVTISAINGNENTMGKANEAKQANDIANELEAIKLAITDAMAKGLNGRVSDVNLRESIRGIIDDSELSNIDGDGPWTITTKLGKSYEINGYGQIEETVVLEPTDIYVALDGTTLRFYNSVDNVPQNLVSSLYTDSNGPRNFKDVEFEPQESSPWYNNRANITRASIENVIVPTITKRWFNECAITGVDHIENLKTNCVTDMSRMFRNCSNLESLDVSKFDTSNVTDMSTMFQLCSKLTQLDVSKFKTDKVTNMKWMFNICSGLTELDVSKWDTSNVTDMSSMFQDCKKLTELDLSNWDTSKVTDMRCFLGANDNETKAITTIYVGDKWNTDKVTQSDYMFWNCNNLVGGAGTPYNSSYHNKARAKIDGGASDPGYFTHSSEKNVPKVGDYIDLGTDINNSGVPTDDWVLLYNGTGYEATTIGGYVYCILADYLPNTNSAIANSGLNAVEEKTYSVKSDNNDILIAALNHTTAWTQLISSTYSSIEGVQVRGSISKDEMDKIKDARPNKDYYLAEGNECSGYWLATPDASNHAWNVYNNGVNGVEQHNYVYVEWCGVCPVVKIPASAITLNKVNNVCKITVNK